MTDHELESRLAQGILKAAPNDLDAVLSRCGTQKKGMDNMTATGKKSVNWRALIAACLALAMIGGGAGFFYQDANAVASIISIDVNPSIELRVNKDETVLSCTPINEEAKTALSEMNGGKDLEGGKLTVAVNAIVGALVRHGYLDGLSSAILVSVEDKDQNRAQRLEEELKTSISDLLATEAPATTLISQTLPQNTGYSNYSYHSDDHHSDDHHSDSHHSTSGISSGKAALVQKVMEMNGTLALNSTDAYDKLCALTVEELNDLLETGEKRIPIGREAAAWAVEEYAGTLILSSVVVTEVDPELDDPIPHYEVELKGGFGEFEYKVDAFTGEILSGIPNVLGQSQSTETAAPDPQATPAPEATPKTQAEPAFQTSPSQTASQPQATPAAAAQTLIGEDAAWSYAYAHAGCAAGDAAYARCEIDYERGQAHHYELEFCWGSTRYEYEIDCYTGAVLKHEQEYCDEEHHNHHSTAPASSGSSLIGEDAAWGYVYAHAGCTAGDVAYTQCELDYEDGRPACYELEFCWGGNQYEYEIDCYSGAVLKHEWERCDEGWHDHGGHHSSQGHHN